jgi:hypothetical protein
MQLRSLGRALISQFFPSPIERSIAIPSAKYSFALEVMGSRIDISWLEHLRSWDEFAAAPPPGPQGEDLKQWWSNYADTFWKQCRASNDRAVNAGVGLRLAGGWAIADKWPGATLMRVHLVTHEALIWVESQQLLIIGVGWPYGGQEVNDFIAVNFPEQVYQVSEEELAAGL